MADRDDITNQKTDITMLEELAERGNLNPIHISEAINRHRNYVTKRVGFLVDAGYVENLDHGLYTITDRGREYIESED
ncbi:MULTISPECIES: hypothetical protein [Haloarcula]|uniref:PhiH1 repressor-like protein n=3 Tax=Haloarcula TaxID=2237 RepID=A0A830F3G1_9EURY|nr:MULTISPECIES: hypothetical protein [Haloarcula]EMA31455.1 hypothetical protein C444_08125 [Haloarcula japonica DSM 6131]GGK78672.1 hypothetical protein GCM10009067_33770 [Haloarcula sebkhae]